MNALLAGVGWVDLAATATLAGGLAYASLVAEPSAAGSRALRVAVVLLVLALLGEFILTALRMREVAGVDSPPCSSSSLRRAGDVSGSFVRSASPSWPRRWE